MTSAVLNDLPAQWREQAATYALDGATAQAAVLRRVAVQLEEALKAVASETLSLVDAARASGYSADHLGRLVREEKIPNVGRANAPRIRRCDLPQKPGVIAGPRSVSDFEAIKRTALKSRTG